VILEVFIIIFGENPKIKIQKHRLVQEVLRVGHQALKVVAVHREAVVVHQELHNLLPLLTLQLLPQQQMKLNQHRQTQEKIVLQNK
jgi:hypothetical protein